MKAFQCHKTVHAEPMTAGAYFAHSDREVPGKINADDEGYHVVYSRGTPDEYHSWSPKKAFDEGHTAIEEGTSKVNLYPILKYFKYDHLPDHLKVVSKPFADLAHKMANELDSGPEVSAGLRKLLEAKDCAVRAMVK